MWFELIIFVLISLTVYLLHRVLYLSKGLSLVAELLRAYLRGDLRKRLYPDRKDKLQEVALLLNSLAERYEQAAEDATRKGYSLKAVLESIPDGIALMGSDERIEMINPSFENLVSMKSSEVIGSRLNEVLRVPEVLGILEKVKKDKVVVRDEFYYDDTERHYEAIACPLKSDSLEDLLPVVLILRDITEVKRTEQIRRDFVANVSHELKTPITTIKGFAETLLDGAMDEPDAEKEFLQNILFYSQRMENLVNDLIQLTKIESGVLTINTTDVSIAEVFNEVCEAFRDRASEKGLRLYHQVQPEDLSIKADPLRLTQILQNLTDNAIKFTDTGEVLLRAFREVSEVVMEVSDTGTGIPRWAIPRLGERFFRVDPSRSRALGGTGLGLAIVKHLVLAHGWSISFDSSPGQGTTVRISIP